MALSLLMPFSTIHIDLSLLPDKSESEEIIWEAGNSGTFADVAQIDHTDSKSKDKINRDIFGYLVYIYITGLLFFVSRLLAHFIKIIYLFGTSKKIRKSRIVLLSRKNAGPFTFFAWIFIPDDYYGKDENKDIITHERIHASQYHSIDIILIELLSAVMWFNPLVWMMKTSVQLVHEYLADEGVLNTGTDKLRYQALLINQVTEERLICLSSSFNHSLIKKRMIMMTKSKFNQGSKLKILTLIPLATFLFIGIACLNGQRVSTNPETITVIVDVGHGGKDPGAKLNDEITEKDLSLSIAKMLKERAKSNTNFNLILTREKDVFLELNERIVSDADLFISIHNNFSENTEASGIECYIAKDSGNKTESENIGKLFVSGLNQLSGIGASLKEADFFVLRESKCPAILLNIGYISSPNDLAYITNKHNQELICDKILDVIDQLN